MHKRKEGAWQNQEAKRQQAEVRWALRDAMTDAEAKGVYCFQEEYNHTVAQRLRRSMWTNPDEEGASAEGLDALPGDEGSPTTFDAPLSSDSQKSQLRKDFI